ncbi:MAG: hypothetical protein ABIN58_11565 [candidate division WOR-3 bacterium]
MRKQGTALSQQPAVDMAQPILLDKGREKIVDYALHPDLDRLPEFTVIPAGSAMLLALQMARHHLFDPDRHEVKDGVLVRYVSLSELAIYYYFRLQRSVNGTVLKLAMDAGTIELGGGDEIGELWQQ